MQVAPLPEYIPLPGLLLGAAANVTKGQLAPATAAEKQGKSKIPAPYKGQFALEGKGCGAQTNTPICYALALPSTPGSKNKTPAPFEGVLALGGKACDARKHTPICHTLALSSNEASETGRWWTTLPADVLCPVSNFPIKLLPYPPFRWQEKVGAPKNRIYLDGKLLALQMIIDSFNGQETSVCGRKPAASDIRQLDDYVRRCKLGPFKVAFVRQLTQEVMSAGRGGQSGQSYQDLLMYVELAMREMKRIHGIQHSRLARLTRGSKRQEGTYQ